MGAVNVFPADCYVVPGAATLSSEKIYKKSEVVSKS